VFGGNSTETSKSLGSVSYYLPSSIVFVVIVFLLQHLVLVQLEKFLLNSFRIGNSYKCYIYFLNFSVI